MTAVQIVSPVFVLRCDADGCIAEWESEGAWSRGNDWATRGDARDAGWQTRPPRGKGSRSAPDLCPEHRTESPAVAS